jgi:hypothetical protein
LIDASTGVDGFANVNGSSASICFGGSSGDVNVVINGIPSAIGTSSANVVVESVSWVNTTTAVSGTTTISSDVRSISGGSMTVSLTGLNANYGYRISLSPGSGTPTPTPGGGVIVSSGHIYKIVNSNSGLVLGITGAATTNGAIALQWSDSGTTDHNWVITAVSNNTYYILKNVNSGRVLGIVNMATTNGALAVQWDDNGTADHL